MPHTPRCTWSSVARNTSRMDSTSSTTVSRSDTKKRTKGCRSSCMVRRLSGGLHGFKEVEKGGFFARDERVGPGYFKEISLAAKREDRAEHPCGRAANPVGLGAADPAGLGVSRVAGEIDGREMQPAGAIERDGRAGEVALGQRVEAELAAPAVDIREQAARFAGEGDNRNVGVAPVAANGEAAEAHRAERLRLPVSGRCPGQCGRIGWRRCGAGIGHCAAGKWSKWRGVIFGQVVGALRLARAGRYWHRRGGKRDRVQK